MADLESALHYLLRVELATHNTLGGEELNTFKSVVTVIAKVRSIPRADHGPAPAAAQGLAVDARRVRKDVRGPQDPRFA